MTHFKDLFLSFKPLENTNIHFSGYVKFGWRFGPTSLTVNRGDYLYVTNPFSVAEVWVVFSNVMTNERLEFEDGKKSTHIYATPLTLILPF